MAENRFFVRKALLRGGPKSNEPQLWTLGYRMAKTIGIAVDVLEGHRLGADVAAAERVVPVAPNRADFITTDLNGETADRLAQIAGPKMSRGVVFLHLESSVNCTGDSARLQ